MVDRQADDVTINIITISTSVRADVCIQRPCKHKDIVQATRLYTYILIGYSIILKAISCNLHFDVKGPIEKCHACGQKGSQLRLKRNDILFIFHCRSIHIGRTLEGCLLIIQSTRIRNSTYSHCHLGQLQFFFGASMKVALLFSLMLKTRVSEIDIKHSLCLNFETKSICVGQTVLTTSKSRNGGRYKVLKHNRKTEQ